MVDFRYHALSLVAVFLALGIGIVLGVTVGDSLVSDADRNLRDSLRGDVEEARDQARDEQELGARRDDVIEELAPEVADGRLSGRRVAVVALGELPADLADSVEEAVEAGGGRLARRIELATAEMSGRPRALRRRGARLARRLRAFDAIAVYREPPADEPDEDDAARADALADGLLRRLRDGVGVETLGTEPSQVGFYDEHALASVDNVETAAGRLALVLLLGGVESEGSFGYKDSAEQPIPDLSD
jgi:hypothetical protein